MPVIKRAGCGLIFVYLVAGCMLYVERLPRVDTRVVFPPVPDHTNGDVVVGVALSGGGSRAAVFSAGGLEAPAKMSTGNDRRSLLEKVSYVSSVSGESLAAAYCAAHKPTHDVSVLESTGLTGAIAISSTNTKRR